MRFLSDEWFCALADVVSQGGDGATDGPPLAIGQVITGTPAGDVAYTVVLGGPSPGVRRPGVADAQVVLVEDYETALQIASGRALAEVLAAGRVKVRGDAAVLLAAQERLAALAGPLGELAEATELG
ncbi:MAG TPA: hypothetical protein VKV23_02860 [Acidimicrobiales bacterium]|jgi:hypothetical protein|nr:hypothetical protein [Acidimicrobiales bacterium]